MRDDRLELLNEQILCIAGLQNELLVKIQSWHQRKVHAIDRIVQACESPNCRAVKVLIQGNEQQRLVDVQETVPRAYRHGLHDRASLDRVVLLGVDQVESGYRHVIPPVSFSALFLQR